MTANTSKTKNLIRSSLKDAAIYEVLAETSADPQRARDFQRLREIQITAAHRLSRRSLRETHTPSTPRFSVSLALFKLATRVLRPERIAGFLRSRFRRVLSEDSDEYIRHDLRDEAVQSMRLLDRLSQVESPDSGHAEYGSLATRSGALRAAVLGVNDGLVSNTTLTLGVAAGTSDPIIVVIAGAAGLVGGALSMAAGEYVSVVSQRDFNENLVRWERAELMLWYEEEEEELAEILQSKGLDDAEAKSAAARIMSDLDTALEVHAREELNIDIEELGGSPWTAAFSSLWAFAGGALVPLIPYAIGLSGTPSTLISATASAVALALVGGSLGWLSGSGKVFGGLRMLAVGLIAGALTYGLGLLVGQQLN